MFIINLRSAGPLLGLLMLIGLACGQDASQVSSPSRGFNPDSVYATGDIDSIDMSSGNLTLSIPITSLPPGRAGLSAGIGLTYSSKLWETNPYLNPGPPHSLYYLIPPLQEGGWQYGFDYELIEGGDVSANQITSCSQFPLRIIFPDKSRHALYAAYTAGAPSCTGSNSVWYSLDGSSLRLVMHTSITTIPWTWTLYLPNGAHVDFSNTGATIQGYPVYETITDRNGNAVELAAGVDTNQHTHTFIQDVASRVITIDQAPPGVTSIDTITAPGPNNTTLTWTIDWSAVTPNATYIYETSISPEPTAQVPALYEVSSITLPNSRQYTFSYGGKFGEVSSMTTPLGATTAFAYTLDGGTTTPTWTNVMFNAPKSKTVTYLNQYGTGNTTESWTYSFPIDIATPLCSNATSSTVAPDGGTTTSTFVSLGYSGIPCAGAGLISTIVKPDGSVTERNWQQNIPYRATQEYTFTSSYALDPPFGAINPFVAEELTSDTNAAGSPVITTSIRKTQDKNGNATGQTLYDYAAYSSLHSGSTPIFGSGSVGGTLHTLSRTLKFPTPDSTDTTTNSSAVYTETTASTLFQLASSVTTGGLQTANYVYDGFGNMTSESIGSITWSHRYDGYGNKTADIDANLTQTNYTFGSISCPVGSIGSLYPTQVQVVGLAVPQFSTYGYDCNNGQVTSSSDPNGVQTTNTYSSASPYFGRLESTSIAGLTTQYSYDDVNRTVQVTRDVATLGGAQSVTLHSYDELGRPWLTQQFEYLSDTSGIKVETQYPFSSAGRFKIVTNPYRAATPTSSTEDTMGWDVTAYDKAGRVTSTTHYSGAAEPPAWPGGTNSTSTGQATSAYDADTTALRRKVTVTDEAQNAKAMSYDGASRLVQAYEDPATLKYLTCYGYDALDNLKQVQQQGTTASPSSGCTAPLETRTFNYDSLKRLTSATNPESRTIQYIYDGNGNLTSRLDANSITTMLQYDKLNRVGSKHYSSGSPGDSVFCYDGDTTTSHGGSPDWSCAGAPSGGSNLIGRTTMVSNPASITQYSAYDAWGRVLNSKQTTQGVAYPFTYSYDAAGDLLTESYPYSGRLLTYGYDNIGRAATVAGSVGTMPASYVNIPIPPSSGYAAQGAIQQMTLGGLTEQTCFNARLQPIIIRQLSGTSASSPCGHGGTDVLRLSLGYSATNNNGNLASQTIAYPTATFSQTYTTYDSVNRLITASETGPGTGWSQTYGYSYAGNRWVSANSGLTLNSFTPVASTVYDSYNHMNGSSALYDLAGNQTQIGGYTFQFDAENRITSSTINDVAATYSYDGQGQRVMKQSGGTTTVFVYDASGGLVQEYATGTIPTPPCDTCYLMADHLGSTRLLLDGTGVIKEKHDYLPFGEEIGPLTDGRDSSWGGPDPRQKFTGKERDAESGLDYFSARYMSSAQGRFTSPDLVNLTDDRIVNPSNTLNKYVYGGNNPLKYTDPDGRDITVLYEQGAPTGHVMMAAVIQQTGDSAILSVGPATQHDPNAANPLNWFSGVPGTTTFNLPKTADELRQNFAALTIQTSPEVAQQAIDAIRSGAGSGNWALLGNNCTSACAKVLHDIGLLPNGLYSTPFPRPNTLWNTLRYKYQPNLSASQRSNLFQNSGSLFKVNNGTDYGSPRFGMNTFDFIMLTLPKQENVTSKICFTDENGKQVCQ